uniref:Uncharacterized protein n=1 Tax=Brassica oleracea TaxID=3712 RepID=A0A3P6EQY9_BRAOL|nr:unnamed protein product [Brassica oleracea]
MFFRDVTMRPHQEELRFRLIHFWEARNPNTKTLTGVEMLLIDEQDSPVLFGKTGSGSRATRSLKLIVTSRLTFMIILDT